MKVVIRRGVSGADIDTALPRRYAGISDLAVRRIESCTVLAFAHERVACSNDVKRALARLGQLDRPLVAFAADLTIEAAKLLEDAGARTFTLRSFGWTDERYQAR